MNQLISYGLLRGGNCKNKSVQFVFLCTIMMYTTIDTDVFMAYVKHGIKPCCFRAILIGVLVHAA